jgi:hypothetical protein
VVQSVVGDTSQVFTKVSLGDHLCQIQ